VDPVAVEVVREAPTCTQRGGGGAKKNTSVGGGDGGGFAVHWCDSDGRADGTVPECSDGVESFEEAPVWT
jgi:hypothetical protein